MTGQRGQTTVQGTSDGPETPSTEINGLEVGDGYRECIDCGHPFHIDSTPELDRCWSCAEEADQQAAEGWFR